jgi:hypothetical protein
VAGEIIDIERGRRRRAGLIHRARGQEPGLVVGVGSPVAWAADDSRSSGSYWNAMLNALARLSVRTSPAAS